MCANWQDITEEELSKLYLQDNFSDSEIANKYNVSISKVRYKRKKFGLTAVKRLYQDFFTENSELFAVLNEQAKDRLCKSENINWLSKAITHQVFREGPVEDMHGKGQLSQEDMKTLNKYMVDNIGMMLAAAFAGDWLMLELWLSYYKTYSQNWDNPDVDTTKIRQYMQDKFKSYEKMELHKFLFGNVIYK